MGRYFQSVQNGALHVHYSQMCQPLLVHGTSARVSVIWSWRIILLMRQLTQTKFSKCLNLFKQPFGLWITPRKTASICWTELKVGYLDRSHSKVSCRQYDLQPFWELNFIWSFQFQLAGLMRLLSLFAATHSLLTKYCFQPRASNNWRLHCASPVSDSRVSGSVVVQRWAGVLFILKEGDISRLLWAAQVLTLPTSCLTESFSLSACIRR